MAGNIPVIVYCSFNRAQITVFIHVFWAYDVEVQKCFKNINIDIIYSITLCPFQEVYSLSSLNRINLET